MAEVARAIARGGYTMANQDMTDDPKRQPNQAEGSRETVEQDLGESTGQSSQSEQVGSSTGQETAIPGRPSQAEGPREAAGE